MRITITKLEQDPRGFWTANVSDGNDTVKVDNRIGIWSKPRDPRADHGARDVVRGEVIPEVAKRLRERVKAAEAGLPQDESDLSVTPVAQPRKTFRDVAPPATPRAPRDLEREPRTEYATHTVAQRIAEEMARAGAQAVKEAA